MTQTSKMLKLKRAYEIVWSGRNAELRDMARNGLVVFSGTYTQCVREAKRLGIWYGA